MKLGDRKRAWCQHNGKSDLEHHDFYAGKVFDFFENERDKNFSEVLVVVSAFAILAITIQSHAEVNVIKIPAISIEFDTWWAYFSILLASNLIPMFFVLTGRRMRLIAMRCNNSIQQKYTEISGNAIMKNIDQ